MNVKLKSGEKYEFNIIKQVVDKGEIVEITGNFAPKTRYKTIEVWKRTIANWDEITRIYPISREKYYCTKCERNHTRGEIYKKHLKYKKKKETKSLPDEYILEYEDTLRLVAARQLMRLKKKAREELDPKRRRMYIRKINELLVFEGAVNEKDL